MTVRVVLVRLPGDERLADAIASDADTTIAGITSDGAHAAALARRLRPDAIVVDAGLPERTAFEAIRSVMAEHPTPIIVAVEDGPRGAQARLEALQAGALLVVPKPPPRNDPLFAARSSGLLAAVQTMGRMTLPRRRSTPVTHANGARTTRSAQRAGIVAVAASTGGPAAFHQILGALPEDFGAPILVTQHLSSGFVEAMVRWLDGTAALTVKVAENGERLNPGTVYVAADGHHLTASREGTIELSDAPPAGQHRPSATVMFESVAASFGRTALGVVLTGMGADGVAGLAAIRRAGGAVFAQDEATSVVFGMPRAAIEAGVVDRVLPLEGIARHLVAAVSAS